MKVRDVIKLIERDGWYTVAQKGSHRQFKHREKKGKVTISVHSMNDDISKENLKSIFRQAGIKLRRDREVFDRNL